jgi:hypothetical protein
MSSKGASLTIAEAEDLLRNKWDITLYDKTQLEPGVAAVLSRHSGHLDLRSVKTLSTDDARSLAQHRGLLHLWDLSSISDEALRALAKHEGPLIVRCPEELSEAQAAAFGQHKGPLYLEGVQQLSAAVASRLARHEGALYLNDVRSLSLPAAEALSEHQGPLYLFEVSKVSDEVAEALVRHQGQVGIFPLAEMSDRARTTLREHRQRVCAEQGLPPRSELEKLAGTFHPAPAGKYNEWAYIYYPRLTNPDPVLVRIFYWRSDWVTALDKRPPSHLPDWFISLLPKIGECIEVIYLEPYLGYLVPGYGRPPAAYLLDVCIELVDDKIQAMGINSIDAEGIYWEAWVNLDSFPQAFDVQCWGGDHLENADYFSQLPLHHSIHESTLEGLKWWQKNTHARAEAADTQ